MCNANDPEPRPLEWCGPHEDLPLQAGAGVKSFFVEDLRGEPADARCQPPRLGQENAAIGRNGLVSSEDVVECRHTGSFGMASLLGLLELLRITEENDALGSV